MNLRIVIGVVLVAMASLAVPATGRETGRPIRLLVGFPAGSAADSAGRTLAESLRDSLGQSVVVDNRPGAGGRIAAELLQQSPADGSTLLLAPMGTMIFFPVVVAKLAYDPWKDFVHISQVATLRLGFAVAPSMPAKSLREYLTWAKANPGKASYGSAGAGTPPHFLGLMLGKAAGIELSHVAYKGGPPLVTDMLGGHIHAGMGTFVDFSDLHRAGKLRILAIGGATRPAGLPDVPTFREQGYDLDGMTWLGVHAPGGMKQATVDRFAATIAAATRKPDVQERFQKLGFELTGTSAEGFVRIMKHDREKWEPVIRTSGFKAE
ncbi:MAG TPA: Bug family tripartite tricarboxylate transporter substrate binding protein [Burkholderiales bacterium]|nr:Bug family tripartite tricarboxylate transporter substrate binding protein [Burkholderiales bacterium]